MRLDLEHPTMDMSNLVATLTDVETQLRDLAYEALQRAADGDEDARDQERQLLKARRAVEKAIRDLGGGSDDGF